LNGLVDFHDVWYGGNVIHVDLDTIIFNPISSTILKWLWFKVISWGCDFQPCTQWFGIVYLFGYYWDCLIVGLFWLRHVEYLGIVTMVTLHAMTYVGKVGELVLSRTSCSLYSLILYPHENKDRNKFS
jgi:hypothetical protein